jgi:hypothetical protein
MDALCVCVCAVVHQACGSGAEDQAACGHRDWNSAPQRPAAQGHVSPPPRT